MAIPDYQAVMLPLLQFASDRQEHSLWAVVEALSRQFDLTDEERRQLLPSGQQTVFYNRVGWARTYMKQAGLLDSTRRGYLRITERGLAVLGEGLSKIDTSYLEQFAEFRQFKERTREKITETRGEGPDDKTPIEVLEGAYQNLRDRLIDNLRERIKECPPGLFEKIVVEVLVSMGYGGSRKDAGQAVGGTGDGGIDGIIKEDRLGLDVIYIQAKRWDHTVGRPEIQRFAGALQGQRARKGIFVTTSDFSREAYEYASSIDSKIILIDGKSLAQSMVDLNVGVTPDRLYEVKKIDSDYFVED